MLTNHAEETNAVTSMIENLYQELSKVVIGRHKEIKLLLAALLSKGHILLEDLPGMGKTTLVKAFSLALNCSFKRIQCTPDLLPSDVIGMSIFNPKTAEFSFRPGPIFTNILLVDEVNRALPRTQSSLLEGMEERQVSFEGKASLLENPFMVLATQNPIEMEGTFPLPEAQLDRFLMKIGLGYPSREEEEWMLEKVGDELPFDQILPLLTPALIVDMQKEAENVFVHPAIRQYIVALANETRNHPMLSIGVSPRASKALYKTVKAWALLDGRDFVLPDDVKELLVYLWSHRVVVNSEGSISGMESATVLQEITHQVPIPQESVGRTS